MKAVRLLLVLISTLVAASCDDGTTQQLENEIMLMQERLVELETQVADAQGLANRLSGSVGELQAYVSDVETEVIDLSAHVQRDLLVNVEATLGNAKTKLTEVRARSDALATSLRPPYAEE